MGADGGLEAGGQPVAPGAPGRELRRPLPAGACLSRARRVSRTARAAYDTLGAWASQCEATVRSLGYDTGADNGQWYPVETAGGLAQFRRGMSYGRPASATSMTRPVH